MLPCIGCSRFIRGDARRCPFCSTIQRDTLSPVGTVAGVLLGLALSACGGSSGDDGAGTMSSTAGETTVGSTTMNGSTVSASSVNDSTMSGASTMSSSSVGDTDGEAAVTAYGGPDVDTSPPEETNAEGDTMTGTGTGTSTGTGTGTSTSQ